MNRSFFTVKDADGEAVSAINHDHGAVVRADDGYDYRCEPYKHPTVSKIWVSIRKRPSAKFAFSEDDLLQLARGVVPEWLRFDADAALDEELSK